MSREMEGRIGALAGQQHGVMTYRQLLEAGVSPCALRLRVRSGRARRLHRGVYLVIPFTLLHTRDMAAVLASGPGAMLSYWSAAALWELHTGPAAEAPVHVSVVGNRGRSPGIQLHRLTRLLPEECGVREGVPVTTPARTLLDLAGRLPLRELEAAVARAERERLVTADGMMALLARHRRHPGVRALRAVLEVAGGPALTRSAAEEKFLALTRAAGLPAPRCNVRAGSYELDFLWPAAGLAVEVDGFRYHGTRHRFESDRRRDAELLAQGITVMRLSWRQLTDGALATMVQLGQALARAPRG